jgi:hypothetical protein
MSRVLLQARHEGVWGSGCIDPCSLDLGISWRWVVSSTSSPFTSGERDPGTDWTGGWVNPRAGLDDMEKWKFLPPACSVVPYPLGYQTAVGTYSSVLLIWHMSCLFTHHLQISIGPVCINRIWIAKFLWFTFQYSFYRTTKGKVGKKIQGRLGFIPSWLLWARRRKEK